MRFLEIVLIAVGLAADAFAVSVCKGMAKGKFDFKYAAVIGLYFGGFQALMPVIGFFAGSLFAAYITSFDHWVAFGLLALIGFNMIRESFSKEGCERTAANISFAAMLPLAVATSIDAAAVGITFAFLEVNIIFAAIVIGIITFAASVAAVWMGTKFSDKLKSISTLLGGVVLVAIGLKILIEGLIS